MKKNLLKKLELTTAGIVSLGLGSVITTNTNWVQAANKNQTVTVKKNAKGYVYKNKSLSKVASKNVKKEFGNNKLVVKRLATIKRHGKKQQFYYLLDKVNHKKVGWVYDKSVQVNKAKKAKVSKKNYKKTNKKHEKGYSSDEIWKTLNEPQAGDGNSNSGKDAFGEKIYNKDEAENYVLNNFINYVNKVRQENGKELLVRNSNLDNIAEKRITYANINGSDVEDHNTTEDGIQHNTLAAVYDGIKLGVFNNDNVELRENNSYTEFGSSTNNKLNSIDKDDVDGILSTQTDMIDNDGASNNGHRNNLLSNDKYYGIAVKLIKNSNNYEFKLEMVQSNTNY